MSYHNLKLINPWIHQYRSKTPLYGHVVRFLRDRGLGDHIKSDHIALRTFRRNNGFAAVRQIMLANDSYCPRDCYQFPSKHVQAQWFSPSHLGYPRVATLP